MKYSILKNLFTESINQNKWLMVICAVGNVFLTMPAYAEITDTHVTALVEALRQAATKADTDSFENLYSDWRVKPANIANWSKTCVGEELTPTEFVKSPEIAKSILNCKMSEVLLEQYQVTEGDEALAVQRAAEWWLTGNAETPASYYSQKVLQLYQQQRGGKLQKPLKTSVETSEAIPASTPQSFPTTSLANSLKEIQLDAFVEALRLAAPQSMFQDDGLYSEWQIKPENISRWSKRCLGKELTPAEAETDTYSMRYVVKCKMAEILSEQYRLASKDESVAVRKSAAWWMTGDPEQYVGSASIYSQKVLIFYQQSLSNN